MKRIIGTDDMRKRMGEVLDCVNLRGDEFVITRKNKSLAVLIPLRKLQALDQMAKSFLLDFSYDQNEYNQEEIDQISNEAKHESRPVKRVRKAKRK